MNPRISPVPDGERLIHNRSYGIDSYRIDSNTLRLRGRVTELFGGPGGCTHVGALLRAMAPVAIQASYSMPRAEPNYDHRSHQQRSPEQIERDAQFVINSCHVWEETGSFAKRASAGRPLDGAPVWIRDRLAKLGRSSEDSNW